MDRYGDLQDHGNFIQLIEMFNASNYFALSGLGKDIFYEKASAYQEFFRFLMGCYAEQKRENF